MKEKLPDNCKLAHFTNDFARNAEIGFTKARQLLLFLALVSQTNPFDDKEEMTGVLNVCEIERLIRRDGTAKSGSLYDEVKRFVQNMLTRNYVQFTPNVDDKAAQSILKDYNVIFDRLRVVKKGGGTYYQYRFHEDMRPHIKMLKRNFVSLTIPKNVKSGHAIRFLMLSKAHHDRVRAYKQVSQLKLSIDELNRILGIQGKYKRFNNLKIRVIEPIIKEVNASGLLNIVNHEYLKTGYAFSHIEFSLKDGDLSGNRETAKATPTNSVSNATVKLKLPKGKKDFIPSLDDENQLKQGQYLAYHFLVQRGCVRGIAYRHIVQKMPSSECLGWEDLYIYNAWKHFESNTNQKSNQGKAGAFVKWWMNGEFKDRHFSDLIEKLVAHKKNIQLNDPKRWENRVGVKDMTHAEFLVWYSEQKAGLETEKPVVESVRKDTMGALDILRRKFGSIR